MIHKMKKYLLLLFASVFTLTACSDEDPIYDGDYTGIYESDVDWTSEATKSTSTLVDYFFDKTDHYFISAIQWDLPATIESGAEPTEYNKGYGYWMQPHAMDIVIDAYLRTGDTKYSDLFLPWLEGIKMQNRIHYAGGSTGLWNNFYDDMLWCALTTLRLYEITGDQTFWDATMTQWDFIKTADNGLGGGGLAWKTDLPYSRMSCSNGPGCLLAAKLYNLCKKEGKETEAAYYLDFAKRTYSWMSVYLCDVSTGQVYDNLTLLDADGNYTTDPSKWGMSTVALSYNQGTFMASALALYQITGEEEYMRNAISFASYQVNKKTSSDYPVFNGEGDNGDNLLFRGVFIRYFLDMIKEPTNSVYTERVKKKYINSLRSNSDVLLQLGRNPGKYFFWYDWTKAPYAGNTGKANVCEIITNSQVSAGTLVEARALYEDWAKSQPTEN